MSAHDMYCTYCGATNRHTTAQCPMRNTKREAVKQQIGQRIDRGPQSLARVAATRSKP